MVSEEDFSVNAHRKKNHIMNGWNTLVGRLNITNNTDTKLSDFTVRVDDCPEGFEVEIGRVDKEKLLEEIPESGVIPLPVNVKKSSEFEIPENGRIIFTVSVDGVEKTDKIELPLK